MENSFSLQFNPMTQLKTVQDYENEIARLQNENFDIKHQLAYYKTNQLSSVDEDIQKLLYDSKTSIDILENENKNMHKQIDHMKDIIRSNNLDKEKLTKEFTDQKNEFEGKICNLEDENQRLISHIENMKNKYEIIYQEHKNCKELKIENENLKDQFSNENYNFTIEINNLKNENLNIRNENNLLRGEINNLNNNLNLLQNEANKLKNEKNTYFTEGEKLLHENNKLQTKYKIISEEKNNLVNLKNDYERRIQLAEEECKNYEKKIKTYLNDLEEYKDSDKYFKEIQRNFSRETRDKQNLAVENENLKNTIQMLNKKVEIIENDKRAMKYKYGKDDGYLYKEMINEISNYKEIVDSLTRKIKKLYLTKDNIEFLTSLNIKNCNINIVVNSFKNLYIKLQDRIEVLRREIHDLNKFNKNEKIMVIVKKLAEEFKNAKYDLETCKNYLEKKSKEIKEIKKEKLGLEKKYEILERKLRY